MRIVTPRRKIDLLHGVAKAREERRPYSIVFIGVNGVGKSTSLAKVSHYLGTRNLKVRCLIFFFVRPMNECPGSSIVYRFIAQSTVSLLAEVDGKYGGCPNFREILLRGRGYVS